MQALLASLHTHRRLGVFLFLIVFFALINVQYLAKTLSSAGTPRSAFLRWSNQIQEMNQGINIWEKHAYPNPPMMALLLAPFTWLPPLVGSLLWFYLKLIMAVLAFVWLQRLVDTPPSVFPLWAKGVTVVLSLRPIQGDLTHGNVNLLILFLVVGCLLAFAKGRKVGAGLLLGLAIACKVTPALFLPYFLWKRAWSTVLGSLAGLILFFGLLPGLFLGWEQNRQGLNSWYRQMVKPFTQGEVLYCDHKNQSLPGFAHRMLTASPSFVDYDWDAGRYVALAYHNVADWDAQQVRWLLAGCMFFYVVLMLWVCRTSPGAQPTPRLVGEFALVILGMLLFSERTWKHHCVLLLVPFAVLAYALAIHWEWPRLRLLFLGILTLAGGLMFATSFGNDLALVYGAYVWLFLLLMGGVVLTLRLEPEALLRDDSR